MSNLLSVEEEWINFKSKFNKSYDSEEEEQKRYQIFQDNYDKVVEHNKKFEAGEESSSLAINQFSDQSQEEFSKKSTGLKATGLRATGLARPAPQ
ncbi:cathepsin L-like proteinase [Sitophilus oryzae]|uniref:Cathepsin L-like proteinase n=1 Tax=Sitophilus oryzae TaxID=7048 RepID=A0A6J2X263_SITOR|nr:cathepsin L-like proteinase [Sitophilus oryzae]